MLLFCLSALSTRGTSSFLKWLSFCWRSLARVVTSSDSTIRSLSPSPAVVMEVRNGFRVRMIVQKINVLVTKLKREFLPVYFWPPNKHCGTYIPPPQTQWNKTCKILNGEGFKLYSVRWNPCQPRITNVVSWKWKEKKWKVPIASESTEVAHA